MATRKKALFLLVLFCLVSAALAGYLVMTIVPAFVAQFQNPIRGEALIAVALVGVITNGALAVMYLLDQ